MAGPDDRTFQGFISDLQSGALSYGDAKQRYQELGDAIRRRYEREITALAVDVVRSHYTKAENDALDAQLIFDAYHGWVEEHLAAHGCDHSFTWSGDGLLAVFDEPEGAVSVGRSLLIDLPAFNARFRQIGYPLQIRVGVHSGPILAGEAGGLGKVASRTFDLAGHLQKAAAPNQMLISETTYTLLHEGGGQFAQVRLNLPNPGGCFAYPPESVTLMPAPYEGERTLGQQTLSQPTFMPPPARTAPTWVPWVLAAAGLAASVGVLVTAVVLWPRGSGTPATGISGTGQPAPVFQNVPAREASAGNNPTDSSNPAIVVQGNAPVPPAAAPTAPQPAPPAGMEELISAPARVQWRSPDADSGVPPHVIPSPPERKWLLAIGVGRYRDRSFASPGSPEDARSAATVLAQSAGVPADHIRVLTDDKATLLEIRRAFVWLQQNASSGKDTIFVYLSGAALMAADRKDLHHPGGSGYAFLPFDANPSQLPETVVYGSDLSDWLAAARAQTLLVFADTSHSGALDVPVLPDPGRQFGVLASAGETQQASAARGPEGSPFLTALIHALRGAADQDRDHRISLTELQAYLRNETLQNSGGAETPESHAGFGGYLPELYLAALQ